ncbi:helix-turn-helix transcriptional regulator [Thermosipho sp. (in: thermotogales)]|jgi:gp16 family phage-associated protein|uniref:helix-turn-helix domain-containing protein n=1 Tax=Thermosipho sp. (in: thermotogales) TaxID=1968895 RepID=UPI00257B1379|nr:helix-turn-helix transcriptional regulator [Thermosipho sp. (in: thermotogales)]MBZ4650925.1 Tsac [Thermosipho sp. (in: thermotogales)]MDK2799766.1 putative transcriptional regulator [Clostridiales bacterium]
MNKIKELVEQKNIKVSEIIKKTGLSKSYVYDVINGKSTPTIGVAQKISRALGSSIAEVFPDTLHERDE